MEVLNDLSFQRLQLVDQFVILNAELSAVLDSARLNISKAKTLNGLVLTNIVQPDTHMLEEASVRFEQKGETFAIIKTDEDEDRQETARQRKDNSKQTGEKETKSSDKEAKSRIPSFRPFGVLEPMAAKDARRTMAKALQVICEIASTQALIRKIDSEMKATQDSLGKDDLPKCMSLLNV